MEIDWTTFALEIVNFVVLVWLLKRFLYRPVCAVLARRQAEVERSLAEGRAATAEAQTLKRQFETRLAEWEKEKAAARAAFDAELAALRERRMAALDRELADARARGEAQDVHRRESLERELEGRAIAQAQRFAKSLLARLAGPAVEARLVDLFIEDFARLPDDQLAGIRASAANGGVDAGVISAAPLDADQRRRLGEAIASRLGQPPALRFSEAPELVAGLRVNLGPWQLKASVADELAFFAAAANHAD